MTIDVSDRRRSERFWGGVLGLEVVHRMEEYSYLEDVAPGVRLILQVVNDPKVIKNRLHVDLDADDPDALLARVEALGGSILHEVVNESYELVVAADPDGNEFCVARRLSPALRA